jgi:small nuclear ribonucleoprotein (snRNP)-like protein
MLRLHRRVVTDGCISSGGKVTDFQANRFLLYKFPAKASTPHLGTTHSLIKPLQHYFRNQYITMLFFRYARTTSLSIYCTSTYSSPAHSFFKTLVDHEVTVELKNDIQIRGTLKSVDQYLNIKLDDISVVEELKYPHLVSCWTRRVTQELEAHLGDLC